MSVRLLFVVSLNDSKLNFCRNFPTVERRWNKKHIDLSHQSLPVGQDLLNPLLNELGLLKPNSFQVLRDSCQKDLQAPLFWIPHETTVDACQQYWPVIVVECLNNRLLCGVPYLDQVHPFGNKQSICGRLYDVAIVLELLSKLTHIIQIPSVTKMAEQLNAAIQNWFPFGRASGNQQLELSVRPVSHKKSWLKSKPKVEVQIKEEVKMIASATSVLTELYGTIFFNAEHAEVECSDIKLELNFSKMSSTSLQSVLFHPSALVMGKPFSINIQQLLEKTFPLCHYSFLLEIPPIQPILKIRSGEQGKVSIFVQLHINASVVKSTFNRLEARLQLPDGNRIARILTTGSHVFGMVSLRKDGSQLIWNLIPPVTASSSSTKLKEDMTLNLDVEMDASNASIIDTQAIIFFSSHGTTLTGANLCVIQPTDFKLVTTSEMKSSFYRVWNFDAVEVT